LPQLYQNAANQLAFTGSGGTVTGTTTSTPNLDTPHIWCVEIGALARIRQDDTATSAGTPPVDTGTNTCTGLQFGSRAGAFGIVGKMARFVGYNRILSRSERTTVMLSLAVQYNFVLS
jgi:hypothetical protein